MRKSVSGIIDITDELSLSVVHDDRTTDFRNLDQKVIELLKLGCYRFGKLIIEGYGDDYWETFTECTQTEYAWNFGIENWPYSRWVCSWKEQHRNSIDNLPTIVCDDCKDVVQYGSKTINHVTSCIDCKELGGVIVKVKINDNLVAGKSKWVTTGMLDFSGKVIYGTLNSKGELEGTNGYIWHPSTFTIIEDIKPVDHFADLKNMVINSVIPQYEEEPKTTALQYYTSAVEGHTKELAKAIDEGKDLPIIELHAARLIACITLAMREVRK